MKTKKIIIVSIFLVIIAITAIYTITGAVKSYNYDMDPANGPCRFRAPATPFAILPQSP